MVPQQVRRSRRMSGGADTHRSGARSGMSRVVHECRFELLAGHGAIERLQPRPCRSRSAVSTMKQYVQTDLEADRLVANTLAELIIGGSLASVEIGTDSEVSRPADDEDRPHERHVYKSV